MRVIDKVVGLFLPSEEIPTLEREQRIFLAKLCFVMASICFAFSLLRYFVNEAYIMALSNFISATSMIIPLIMIKRKFSIVSSASTLLGLASLGIFAMCFLSGGIRSATIVWYVLFPLAGGALVSRRCGLIFTGLSVIQVGILGGLEVAGYQYINEFGTDPSKLAVVSLLNTIAALGVGFAISSLYLNLKQNVIEGLNSTLDELNLTKSTLEKKLDENNLLLRVIFHDIANPLAISVGSTKIARKLNGNSSLDRWLEKIERANKIQKMVLAKVKSLQADMPMEIKPINLGQVVKEVEFIFEDKLKDKNIEFNYDHESLSQTWIMADEVILTNEILSNLISNSIKFSYKDSRVKIQIDSDDQFTILKIVDTGIGMSREKLEEAFKPNTLSELGTDGEVGSGFGLKIVKKTIEALGGKLEVQSSTEGETKGTSFILYFLPAEMNDQHSQSDQGSDGQKIAS